MRWMGGDGGDTGHRWMISRVLRLLVCHRKRSEGILLRAACPPAEIAVCSQLISVLWGHRKDASCPWDGCCIACPWSVAEIQCRSHPLRHQRLGLRSVSSPWTTRPPRLDSPYLGMESRPSPSISTHQRCFGCPWRIALTWFAGVAIPFRPHRPAEPGGWPPGGRHRTAWPIASSVSTAFSIWVATSFLHVSDNPTCWGW
jgi:hypothetical protein